MCQHCIGKVSNCSIKSCGRSWLAHVWSIIASISIKPYTKSHLELQREITLIELAPSPYFLFKVFALHIWTCLQGLMKIQQWLLKILRKKSVTDGRTDNVKTVYPPQTKFAGCIITFNELLTNFKMHVFIRSRYQLSKCMSNLSQASMI